ncbi:MAG: glycosyltransferase family 2 protein, partial [Verrucomicrobia bacterium]|nr:glycosyltransferase family 2 protein [Verrucomicrobiota bacterium]
PEAGARHRTEAFPSLEIVTHCWQYARMLVYQLSSFINHPPTTLRLTVTVFYAESDSATVELLAFIAQHDVPNVTWNWQPLPEGQLFRRGIGRNRAALASQADWVWMTDCDIVFHANCLDSLAAQLQGRNDILVYPRQERTTPMLPEDSSLLQKGQACHLVEIDPAEFDLHERDRAKGAFQIIHGDIARAIGYCNDLRIYQTPADHWCKCYEDRAFRWLVGTQGTPLEIEGVYQIRHIEKGRYRKGAVSAKIRSKIRHMQE